MRFLRVFSNVLSEKCGKNLRKYLFLSNYSWLRHFSGDMIQVYSAGTHPEGVNPLAIHAMKTVGVDISHHTSDYVDDYLDVGINTVITVCDNANQVCPTFPDDVERIHWSIDDPFRGWNFNANQLDSFRETRKDIRRRLESFLESH